MSTTFAALGVSAPVTEALARRDIHTPFAIQTLVLPDALAGVDVLAASPTGSGKTLAFGIPMIERTRRRDRPIPARSSSSRRASSPRRSSRSFGRSPTPAG